MAVKPSATVTWATNALYTVGPSIGNNTKEPLVGSSTEGFVPGTGVASEQFNEPFNILGDWSTWLLAGTFNPDLDAHIIETDALGLTSVASVILGGTASASFALSVTENSGATAAAATIVNTAGGIGVQAQTNGTSTAIRGTNTSSGAALDAVATSGHALLMTQSSDLATTVSTVSMDARATEPTVGISAEGDQFFRAGDFHRPGFFDGGEWRYVMGSPGGFIRRYANAPASVSTNASPGYITLASATLQGSDFPVATTTVHVRAVVEVGADIVGNILRLILDDATSSVVFSEGDAGLGTDRFVRTFHGTGAPDERYVTIEADYVLPASGARSIRLRMGSDGGNFVYARFASLEVLGQY